MYGNNRRVGAVVPDMQITVIVGDKTAWGPGGEAWGRDAAVSWNLYSLRESVLSAYGLSSDAQIVFVPDVAAGR